MTGDTVIFFTHFSYIFSRLPCVFFTFVSRVVLLFRLVSSRRLANAPRRALQFIHICFETDNGWWYTRVVLSPSLPALLSRILNSIERFHVGVCSDERSPRVIRNVTLAGEFFYRLNEFNRYELIEASWTASETRRSGRSIPSAIRAKQREKSYPRALSERLSENRSYANTRDNGKIIARDSVSALHIRIAFPWNPAADLETRV